MNVGFSSYKISNRLGLVSEVQFETNMEEGQVTEGWFDGDPMREGEIEYWIMRLGPTTIQRDAVLLRNDPMTDAKKSAEREMEGAG